MLVCYCLAQCQLVSRYFTSYDITFLWSTLKALIFRRKTFFYRLIYLYFIPWFFVCLSLCVSLCICIILSYYGRYLPLFIFLFTVLPLSNYLSTLFLFLSFLYLLYLYPFWVHVVYICMFSSYLKCITETCLQTQQFSLPSASVSLCMYLCVASICLPLSSLPFCPSVV